MAEKRTHFGMAGRYAAMSEFLLRGYNVAVPSVDVGDDVFVVDDQDGSLRRVQVKTADAGDEREIRAADGRVTQQATHSTLSRRQLRTGKSSELYFMLMTRWGDRWRFLLVPRLDFVRLRDEFHTRNRARVRGPKPKADDAAKTDSLGLEVVWTESNATGWGVSLREYLDTWPADLPELKVGPGAVSPPVLP